MKKNDFTRRKFIATVSAGSVGAVATGGFPTILIKKGSAQKLAVLGGEPVRSKNKPWQPWPYVNKQRIVGELTDTVNNGRNWVRGYGDGRKVSTFEQEFARVLGVKRAVGTNSGTSALHCCVEALDIGAGDEVITSPYSDFGTIQSIMLARALPVMADLDIEACGQMDPDEVEKRITKNTKAIMPVHIHGVPCSMDRMMAIAKKHNLLVIEDACQAALAEFGGKKLGSIGNIGAISFNGSKAISSGEGGMIVGNNDSLLDQAHAMMNKGSHPGGMGTIRIAPKYRMHEFEGAVLMGQLPDIVKDFDIRSKNAEYLTSKLREIPGVVPQKLYPGTGRCTYWNYATSYYKEHFNNADRSRFVRAINAECGVSWRPYINVGFHRDGTWYDYMLNLNVYKKFYTAARLKMYRDEFSYPNCDRITDELSVTFRGTNILLHSREDMDDIVNSFIKVYENRDQLKTI